MFVLFLAGVAGAIVLGGVGWLLGAQYGGNYATGFEFAGNRGYEATGLLGGLIGLFLGFALGVYGASRLRK